ncbi:MAG: non-canonical purine NTP pyrophosphatase, partial [Sphaerochaetaceae bacterium]
QRLFKDIANLNLITLAELGINHKADEPFSTPRENAIHKAKVYGDLSQLPTIAIDEAVSTNFLPDNEQPGVFVRRFRSGRDLIDAEVLVVWQEIFKIYNQADRQFIWDFSLSYYNPADGLIKSAQARQTNTVAPEFSKIIDPGYPMSSFLIPAGFDRPHSELSDEECLIVDQTNLRPFVDLLAGIAKILFQLQQLGLPLGFRSKAVWWQNYLISNYADQYGKVKKLAS